MLDVKQTLKDAEERMESAILYLDEELAHIRAGRANVAILDAVRVDSYGSKVPLIQVATVSTPAAAHGRAPQGAGQAEQQDRRTHEGGDPQRAWRHQG